MRIGLLGLGDAARHHARALAALASATSWPLPPGAPETKPNLRPGS